MEIIKLFYWTFSVLLVGFQLVSFFLPAVQLNLIFTAFVRSKIVQKH